MSPGGGGGGRGGRRARGMRWCGERVDIAGLTIQFNHMVKPDGSSGTGRAGTHRGKRGAGGAGGRPRATARAAALAPTPDDERATRDKILAAAHRVFVQQGTAKARTQEIADEAGVNKALVHYYFGTKDALAQEVFATAMQAFMPRVFGILASDTLSIEDKVRTVVREQLDFHLARPYLAPYVMSEAHTEPERVRSIMQRGGAARLDVLRRQLHKAAAAGTMRRIAPEQFVVSLIGLLVFPFMARPMLEVIVGVDAARFSAFIEARKRELPDFFLAGLRP